MDAGRARPARGGRRVAAPRLPGHRGRRPRQGHPRRGRGRRDPSASDPGPRPGEHAAALGPRRARHGAHRPHDPRRRDLRPAGRPGRRGGLGRRHARPELDDGAGIGPVRGRRPGCGCGGCCRTPSDRADLGLDARARWDRWSVDRRAGGPGRHGRERAGRGSGQATSDRDAVRRAGWAGWAVARWAPAADRRPAARPAAGRVRTASPRLASRGLPTATRPGRRGTGTRPGRPRRRPSAPRWPRSAPSVLPARPSAAPSGTTASVRAGRSRSRARGRTSPRAAEDLVEEPGEVPADGGDVARPSAGETDARGPAPRR